jgi:hypothetical protein
MSPPPSLPPPLHRSLSPTETIQHYFDWAKQRISVIELAFGVLVVLYLLWRLQQPFVYFIVFATVFAVYTTTTTAATAAGHTSTSTTTPDDWASTILKYFQS